VAQFLRPDGDTTLNSWQDDGGGTTNIFQAIDESSAVDTDFVTSSNNTNDAYTGTVSNPGSTPGAGTVTARYRYRKDASGGHTVNIQVEVLEGGTQRGTATHSNIGNTWTAGSFTVTGVTDFNNLSFRFTRSGDTGGSPGNRRPVQISWFEVETPDGAIPLTQTARIDLLTVHAPTLSVGPITIGPPALISGTTVYEPTDISTAVVWGTKTTLTTTAQTQWGPYRSDGGDYYLFRVRGSPDFDLTAYKSATLTGTYTAIVTTQSTGLGNDSAHDEIQGAWSYEHGEMHWVVIDRYVGGSSGWICDTHGIRYLPASDTWSTAAIETAYEVTLNFDFGIDVAYDETEGSAYFATIGPSEFITATWWRRLSAARWNGSSWDWFNAGKSGPSFESIAAPQGSFSGASRVYAMSGGSSVNDLWALDNSTRSASSESTQQQHLDEGPGAAFDGSTFGADSESPGEVIQRTEGDPAGAPSSKTPTGWGSTEFPTGWTIKVYGGTLYAVAYNATDDDVSYSTLGSAAGSWAAAIDIDTNEATFDNARLLLVDSDDDGLPEKLWLIYDDGTNTVYREWGGDVQFIGIPALISNTTVYAPTLTNAPFPPTGVTYTPGNRSITIDWTDGVGSTHTRIYRGVAEGRLELYQTIAASVETYVDSTLTATLPYVYQLASWDGTQESTLTTVTTARPNEDRTVWRRIETDGGAVGSAVFTVYDESDTLLNTYTDNSPAGTSGLQAAIDAYKAANRWFKFGSGQFNFLNGTAGEENATFNTLDNLRFTGKGMNGSNATIIANSSTDASDTEPLSFTNCDHVIIEHMEVIAAGSGRTTSDGLDFDDVDEAYIHHVLITDSRARALIFDGKDSGAQATLNVIEDVLATSTQTTQGDVLELLGAKRNVFRRVWAYDGGERGMQFNQGGASVTSDDNVIEDSNVTRNNEDGIEILSGNRNIVRRSHIEGNDQDQAGHDGVEVSGSLGADDNEIRDNWISDVQGTKTQHHGVDLTADADATIVHDNMWGGNEIGTINDGGTLTDLSGNVTTETTFAPTPPVALWVEDVAGDNVLRWYDSPADDLDDLTIYSGPDEDNLSVLVASHAAVTPTLPDAETYLNTYTHSGQGGSGTVYAVIANDTDGNSSLLALSGKFTSPLDNGGTLTQTAVISLLTVHAPTLSTGPITIGPPALLSNTITVYEPTLSVGPVTLAASLIDNAITVYEPVMIPDQRLDPALISLTTVYAPTITTGPITIGPPSLISLLTVYAPTLSTGPITVGPPALLSNTITIYAPTLTVGPITIGAPALIDNSITVYEPTLSNGAIPLTQTARIDLLTVFAPTLSVGTLTLMAPHIDNAITVLAPTLTTGPITVGPPALLSNAITVYEPSMFMTLGPPALISNTTVYEPTLTGGAQALTQTAQIELLTVYEPTDITINLEVLVAPLIVSTLTVYAPTLSVGPTTLSAPLGNSPATVYAPMLFPGGVTLNASLITSTLQVFEPTGFTFGPITIGPPALIGPISQVFSGIVSDGSGPAGGNDTMTEAFLEYAYHERAPS
jgi:hypothetical protein